MIFPLLLDVPVFFCCHLGHPSIPAAPLINRAVLLCSLVPLCFSLSGLFLHLEACVCLFVCLYVFVCVFVWGSGGLCVCSTGRPAGTWAPRWWWWAASWWWTPPPSGSLEGDCSAAWRWKIPFSACSTSPSRCREPSVPWPPPLPPPQHHCPSPVAFPSAPSLHTTPRHLVVLLDYLRCCLLAVLSSSAQLQRLPPLLLLPLCRCPVLPRPTSGGWVPICVSVCVNLHTVK